MNGPGPGHGPVRSGPKASGVRGRPGQHRVEVAVAAGAELGERPFWDAARPG